MNDNIAPHGLFQFLLILVSLILLVQPPPLDQHPICTVCIAGLPGNVDLGQCDLENSEILSGKVSEKYQEVTFFIRGDFSAGLQREADDGIDISMRRTQAMSSSISPPPLHYNVNH